MPVLSTQGLGAYRIATGAGLLWLIVTAPIPTIPIEQQRHYAGVDLTFIHSIAASPTAGLALQFFGILCAVSFIVGWKVRGAYPALAVTFFITTLVRLESRGAHDWGVPLVTILGWLAVPWRDGRPAIQQAKSANENRPSYGFAVFWPGFVLGTALAAAAYAKLSISGVEWISSGAVRYHFVTDAQSAPLTWSLAIAASPSLSIALSALTILFEASFILLVFYATNPWRRLCTGLAATVFFAGLYLLQGIWWDPWLVVLLPAFLPWEWISQSKTSPTDALSLQQRASVLALTVSQIVASVTAIEYEPLISNYPMYSHTYKSPAVFDRNMAWRYTNVTSVWVDGIDRIDQWPRLEESSQRWLLSLADGTDTPTPADIAVICTAVKNWNGMLPVVLSVKATRGGFDWPNGRFRPQEALNVQPIQLGKLCPASEPQTTPRGQAATTIPEP
jgi:hypothetical protein